MRLPSWPSGRSWWPRSTLAQFGVVFAASAGLALLLFVIIGFKNDWEFPVNAYRARYYFDDSTVHTTDWTLSGVGDLDGDGCADFAIVSDNELPSGWGSYNWSPGFGAVTVYSGKDGSSLRRVDREALVAAARTGIQQWIVK